MFDSILRTLIAINIYYNHKLKFGRDLKEG